MSDIPRKLPRAESSSKSTALPTALLVGLVAGFAGKAEAATVTLGSEATATISDSYSNREMPVNVDPTDPDHIAYVAGSAGPINGVVMISDGTGSSTEVCSGSHSLSAGIGDLAMDESSGSMTLVIDDNSSTLTEMTFSTAGDPTSGCTESSYSLPSSDCSEFDIEPSTGRVTCAYDSSTSTGYDVLFETSSTDTVVASSNEDRSPAYCTPDLGIYKDADTGIIYWVDIATGSLASESTLSGAANISCNDSYVHYTKADGNIYYRSLVVTEDPVDNDGDGFYNTDEDPTLIDCDDNDANVYPGATPDYTDGKDTDCDDRADTPSITSLEVNGEEVESGATVYAVVGEAITFNSVGRDEETIGSDLSFVYELSGDIDSFATPYQLTGSSGETVTFTPQEQGTIDVVLTLADEDGNEHTFEFSIVAGVSSEDLTEGETIEAETIIVDGDGATTIPSESVVVYENGEIVIQDGYVTMTGLPDSTYAGMNPDGEIVSHAQIALNPDGDGSRYGTHFLAMGISSRPNNAAGPPPNEGSSYGVFSDNDNPDNQLVGETTSGFTFWGENTDSRDGSLELDGAAYPEAGETLEVFLSDAVDADESEGPDDTGEPTDDTGEPTDDTGKPNDDTGSRNPVDGDPDPEPTGRGCNTAPGQTPAGGSGFGAVALLLGAAVRRGFTRRKEDE